MVGTGWEDQEVAGIGREDQEMVGAEWAAGQRGKGTGQAAARKNVGSLDPGSEMDY